jgi:hypothetical protein
MMPAPLHPTPAGHMPFPPNWRWNEPLEYTPDGLLLPSRKSWIERFWSRVLSVWREDSRLS